MRNFIDLLNEKFSVETRKPGLLEQYLREAQDYTTILAPLKKMDPKRTGLWKVLDRNVEEYRRSLKRVDRIIWFLRLWRLSLLHQWARLNNDPVFTPDVYRKAIAEYNQRFGTNLQGPEVRQEVIEDLATHLAHYLSLPIPEIQNYRFEAQTPAAVLAEFERLENEYKEKMGDVGNPLRFINHRAAPTRYGRPVDCSYCGIDANRPETWDNCRSQERTLIDFGSGLRWVMLKTAACAREAEAMIHCGNSPRSATDDRVLSLRQQMKNTDGVPVDLPHLTFILHRGGLLGEMKAPNNNRPSKRWHKQILALILSPLVNGLQGGTYLPEKDFKTEHLSPEDFEYLLKRKPDVLELSTLWKLVTEKKVAFTPVIARRIAKADDRVIEYAQKNFAWNRETIGAFIGGEPSRRWVVEFLRMLPGIEVDDDNPNMLGVIFAQHPELLGMLGEKNCLPYIRYIGAGAFSEEALKDLTPQHAVDVTLTENDMRRLPANVQNDPTYVMLMIGAKVDSYHRPRVSSVEVIKWLTPEQVAAIPADYVSRYADAPGIWEKIPLTLREDSEFRYRVAKERPQAVAIFADMIGDDEIHDIAINLPRTLPYIPEDRMTQEIADNVVHLIRWQDMPNSIPKKFWSEQVTDSYWRRRAAQDDTLRLDDVPPKYRTRDVYVSMLHRYPDDIPKFAANLDEDIVVAVVRNNKSALKFLPDSLKGEGVAAVLHQAAQTNESLYQWFEYMPSRFMTREAMQYLCKTRGLDFAKIPESLRDEEGISFFLLNSLGRGSAEWREKNGKIPVRYLPPDFVKRLVGESVYVIKSLPDAVVTDEVLLEAINGPKSREVHLRPIHSGWVYTYLKERGRKISPVIMRALVNDGSVPLEEIPRRLMNAETVMRRIVHGATGLAFLSRQDADHLKHIPKSVLNEDLAAQIVERKPTLVRQIPKSLRGSKVLESWLRSFGDRSRSTISRYGSQASQSDVDTFKSFPKSAWTPSIVAMAINLKLLPASLKAVPSHLVDKEVTKTIVAWNPQELSGMALDEETAAHAIERNEEAFKTLPLSSFTEKVALVAMERYALDATNSYQEEVRKKLLSIPRDVWSKPVWRAAVGYVVTLDDVPEGYRDTDLMIQAVRRDPYNARFVPNAAEWMGLNWKRVSPDVNDKRMLALLERGGLVRTKTGFVDVNTLHREEVAGGYKAAVIKSGPVNKRVYIFNPTGHYVFSLYSEKDQVRMQRREVGNNRSIEPDAVTAQPLREVLMEVYKRYFPDTQAGDLWLVRIFGTRGRHATFEEQEPRRTIAGLEWSNADHETGTLYTAWLDDQPIIRIDHGSRGAGAKRGLRDVDVINRAACLANIENIYRYLTRFSVFHNSELESLGIIVNRSAAVLVSGPVVARFGNIDVRRPSSDKYLSIFVKDRLIGWGRPTSRGKIQNVTVRNRWDMDGKAEEKVTEILEKVSLALASGKLLPGAE